MMSNTKDRFFDEFSPVSRQDWKSQVIKDLKGADYNEKLVFKTSEGFDIEPYYNEEDVTALEGLSEYTGWKSEALTNSLSPRQWGNRPIIEVENIEEANKGALEALQNGADALEFDIKGSVDSAQLSALLKDILLQYCSVSFSIDQSPLEFGKTLATYIRENDYPLNEVRGSIRSDLSQISSSEFSQLIDIFTDIEGIRLFTISKPEPESQAALIANLLSQLVKLIDTAADNIALTDLLKRVEFRIETTNDYFQQIATIRAVKLLVDALILQYSADQSTDSIHVHAITSIKVDEQTSEDPYLNMLSNTNQAMSAIIGGCDSLSILPHNAGIETVGSFDQRIARNVSNILKDESYLDKVADPASGSYYIEYLTNQIAQRGWEEFQNQL